MSDTATPQNIVPGGQVDDPNVLRTDDFGLGGNLRDQLVSALTSRWNPDDPGATTLDDAQEDGPPSADTAASPAPAPQPATSSEPDPPQGQPEPVQDGAGGGRAADDQDQGGAATPPAPSDDAASPGTQPPTPAPTDQEIFDLNAYARDYFGTDLTREQSQRLFSMLSRLQSLSPEEQAWIDGVLSGGQAGQYPGTMGQPVAPGAVGQPAQHAVATAPQGQSADDPAVAVLGPRPDADADPYAAQQWDLSARAVRYQAEQTDAIRQDIARTTQYQLEQQQAQAAAKVDAATKSWREQYTVLSDGEFDGLVQRAAQSGTFPALIQAHHGDVEAATRAVLEQQFWADPHLRERAIANMQSGRLPGDRTQLDPSNAVAQQQAAADQGRQALASSVAGGGGAVTPATTEVPADPQKRKQAMVQELAAQHDFTT